MERTDTRDRQAREAVATIGSGVVITGDVACETELQIDGRIHGDVRCPTVFLGSDGQVDGSIHGDRVRISGTVDGGIIAGDLALEPTAQVNGDVEYARMKVTAGAVISGTIRHRPVEERAADTGLKLVDPPKADAANAARRVYGD